MICIGMVMSFLGDYIFHTLPGQWRWMMGAPAVVSVCMLCATKSIPEYEEKRREEREEEKRWRRRDGGEEMGGCVQV